MKTSSATNDDLLMDICGPADLCALDEAQLPELARQVRSQIIDTVTGTGGHLGASLGTVELTIALHRVFKSPHDIIVFDTGHQTYTHKLLTGRAEKFTTLRQERGLSGYPSRTESPHDWVENSHASVSIAWVDGIAKGLALQGQNDRHVVAVIGDGALTGGVAWEGLNNLGGTHLPVIVVLNDNARSYDPTTGAVAAHLRQLRQRPSETPNVFEALGFTYIGPVDGHDIASTCAALRHAVRIGKPVVVHAVTAKGHGYLPAEADDNDRMHACGVVDPLTGRPTKSSSQSWTDVFEEEIVDIGEQRPDVVAMTAAMRLPTGLGQFSMRFPQRVFDSGIAEQHLLASAAGLATAGAHPVVALYSTFLHRGFDQLLFDIGLHDLPVTLMLDRAGVTGPDGPSHHGLWDLALLTKVPGMRVACPRDAQRLREQLRAAIATSNGPTALRYPKGSPGAEITAIDHVNGLDILHADSTHQRNVLLIAIGAMARPCLEAARHLASHGIGATVVDPQWVWPINSALSDLASRHDMAFCVEDGLADSGIGAHLAYHHSHFNPDAPIVPLGLPTEFIDHSARNDILVQHGLTGIDISTRCLSAINSIGPVQHQFASAADTTTVIQQEIQGV